MGLFSRRKKKGKTKTIVLSALRQPRHNDGFERQQTLDGDFDTYRYSSDQTTSMNSGDLTSTVTAKTVTPVHTDGNCTEIEHNNETILKTPTSTTASHDDESIALPPTLFRRTVALPMLFMRDLVESSSTIHSAVTKYDACGMNACASIASKDLNSKKLELPVEGVKPNEKPSNMTRQTMKVPHAYGRWRMESEVKLFHSDTSQQQVVEPDDVTRNDSFDKSEATLFRTFPSDKFTFRASDDVNINEAFHEGLSAVTDTTAQRHPFEWFPSRICLLSFDNDRCPGNNGDVSNIVELSQKTKSAWMKYFVPVPQCIVRNSCVRHVKWHSFHDAATTLGTADARSTNDVSGTALALTAWNRFRTENHIHKDTSSMILHDPIQAKHVIMEFCRNKNYSGAIVVAKNLLRHFQLQASHDTNEINRMSISELIISLQGQLVILCLVAGRNSEASRYSTEAVKSLKKTTESISINDGNNTDGNTLHSAQAIATLLRHGLVLFSTNKVSQAMKAYREALQMAIAMNGFEDTTVSILLCNIGVFHLECGDTKGSLRSLEESLEIQRSILRDGTEARQLGSAEEAIYRLAITMCNLAVAYEGTGQFDQSTSLLEESISLFQSTELDTTIDEEIVMKHLQFSMDRQSSSKNVVDVTILNTSDEAENGVCQFYDLDQSGNSEAIQSFISSAFADDDEDESNKDDMSDSSERSMTLFGNSDGVPSNRGRPWLWLEESDNHDFLLLGPLQPELTAEQRVRETLRFWNGGGSNIIGTTADVGTDDDRNNPSSRHNAREMLKYELSFNGETVVDADLHLKTIHKQAMAYLDENKIDAAVDILYGAVRSHRAKYGATHHLVGSELHNIGMVLFYAQRYSEALSAFENAVVIRDESLNPNHPDIQSSWIKIALIHLAMGSIHRAHDVFSDIRDKLLPNINGYALVQLAKVYNNIGVIAYEFNDLDNALESFKAAYDCQREIWKKCKLDEKHSDDENDSDSCYWHVVKLARANTLCNMAFIYVKVNDYERGLEVYDRAYSILYRLLPKHHPTIVYVVANIDLLLEAMNDDVDQ
jgi:tetratricopeptide (TPR) repeat protein